MRQGSSRIALVLSVTALAASCALETGGVGVDDDGGHPSEGGVRTVGDGAPLVRDDDGSTDAPSTVEDAPLDVSKDVADAPSADAAVDTGIDAFDAGAPGTILTTTVVGTTLDKVSGSDQGLAGDGTADGTFSIAVVGPIDGLILVSTNASGMTSGGSQWDTLVLTDPVPASIGGAFTTGSQTWLLGVYEGTTRVNDAAGRINRGAGVFSFTLYATNNGSQTNGQRYRVYAHAIGGAWKPGPVVQW